MSRPKDKKQLLDQSDGQFQKLLMYIDYLPGQELNTEFPAGTLNRNIKDVLAHLHHWHLMMMSWYEEGMAGIKPIMPTIGYTWRTLPQLNIVINEKYKDSNYSDIRQSLVQSHLQIIDMIGRHTEEELFTKKYYKWTGSTSLAAYLISNSCSHYDWALKLIRKSLKNVKNE